MILFSSTSLILLVFCSFSYFVVINGRIAITIDSSSSEEGHKSRRKEPCCGDRMKNQDETDIDCGGFKCPKCQNMKSCTSPNDCLSNVCINSTCIPSPSCRDQIKNQDETDVDCGGRSCQKCQDMKTCKVPCDCISGVCINNKCIPSPSCQDQIKNQDETDVDCGGSICPKCNNGKACNTSEDCLSDQCRVQFCQTCSLVSFDNGDFESGSISGWTLGGGFRKNFSSLELKPEFFLPGGKLFDASIAISHSAIVTNGNDPNLGNLMPGIVKGGQYSFRVEDLTKGGYASVISRQINNYFCLDIYFSWLAVLQNGNHSSNESSLVIVQLNDLTTDESLILRRYDAGATGSGVDNHFQKKDDFFYTPAWQSEHLTIDNTRFGHNFTLTVLAADCEPTGHVGYLYLDSFSGLSP